MKRRCAGRRVVVVAWTRTATSTVADTRAVRATRRGTMHLDTTRHDGHGDGATHDGLRTVSRELPQESLGSLHFYSPKGTGGLCSPKGAEGLYLQKGTGGLYLQKGTAEGYHRRDSTGTEHAASKSTRGALPLSPTTTQAVALGIHIHSANYNVRALHRPRRDARRLQVRHPSSPFHPPRLRSWRCSPQNGALNATP